MDTGKHKGGTAAGSGIPERLKNAVGNGKKSGSRPRTSRPAIERSASDPTDNPERLQHSNGNGPVCFGTGRTLTTQYDFDGSPVRTVTTGGDTVFIGGDLCAVLGHTNSRAAISRLDDDEKGVRTIYTPGGEQEVNVVTESGMYALIFSSRKPRAKAFRKWVTGQVLPAIRRTGSYDAAAVTGRPGREDVRHVELPGDGLYVVTALPGRATHIRQSGFEDIGPEVDALDAQIMACALATTAALWKRVQQISATGCDPTGSLSLNRFELAVLEGHQLAQRHFLAVETEGRSQEK